MSDTISQESKVGELSFSRYFRSVAGRRSGMTVWLDFDWGWLVRCLQQVGGSRASAGTLEASDCWTSGGGVVNVDLSSGSSSLGGQPPSSREAGEHCLSAVDLSSNMQQRASRMRVNWARSEDSTHQGSEGLMARLLWLNSEFHSCFWNRFFAYVRGSFTVRLNMGNITQLQTGSTWTGQKLPNPERVVCDPTGQCRLPHLMSVNCM